MDQYKSFLKNKSNIINLLVLGILVLAIPFVMRLVGQTQLFKSQADVDQIVFQGPNVLEVNGTKKLKLNAQGKAEVTVKLTSPFTQTSASNNQSTVSQIAQSIVPEAKAQVVDDGECEYERFECSAIGHPGQYTWCVTLNSPEQCFIPNTDPNVDWDNCYVAPGSDRQGCAYEDGGGTTQTTQCTAYIRRANGVLENGIVQVSPSEFIRSRVECNGPINSGHWIDPSAGGVQVGLDWPVNGATSFETNPYQAAAGTYHRTAKVNENVFSNPIQIVSSATGGTPASSCTAGIYRGSNFESGTNVVVGPNEQIRTAFKCNGAITTARWSGDNDGTPITLQENLPITPGQAEWSSNPFSLGSGVARYTRVVLVNGAITSSVLVINVTGGGTQNGTCTAGIIKAGSNQPITDNVQVNPNEDVRSSVVCTMPITSITWTGTDNGTAINSSVASAFSGNSWTSNVYKIAAGNYTRRAVVNGSIQSNPFTVTSTDNTPIPNVITLAPVGTPSTANAPYAPGSQHQVQVDAQNAAHVDLYYFGPFDVNHNQNTLNQATPVGGPVAVGTAPTGNPTWNVPTLPAGTTGVRKFYYVANAHSMVHATTGPNGDWQYPNNKGCAWDRNVYDNVAPQAPAVLQDVGDCQNPGPVAFYVGSSAQNLSTTDYKIAETIPALSSATWTAYTVPFVTRNYQFADATLTTQQLCVQFKASDGTISPANCLSIGMIGSDPTITNCSIETNAAGADFTINGTNFGTTNGTVKNGNTSLTITQWSATSIKATLTNAPAGQAFPITVTKSDGGSVNGLCSAGSAISVGTKRICEPLIGKDISNVKVVIVENKANGRKFNETVTIDKNGTLKGLTTQLVPGESYKVSLQAPKTTRKAKTFTAGAGANNIDDLILPIGDIFPLSAQDNVINTLDKAEMNKEWIIHTNPTGERPADLTDDARVNSFDWACMRLGFNETSDPEPTGAATTTGTGTGTGGATIP